MKKNKIKIRKISSKILDWIEIRHLFKYIILISFIAEMYLKRSTDNDVCQKTGTNQ